jgi:flagellar hook-associated protein 3 FlgL
MSVSDIGNTLSQQYLLSILQGNLDNVSRQNSTGKISGDISGLAPNGVTQAISDRNDVNLVNAYTSNLNTAQTRFTTTDTALTSITDTARDLLSTLQSQLQDTTPEATILSNSATNALNTVTSRLNVQADGRYVFSGQNFDVPSYGTTTTLLTNIGAAVAAGMADPTTTTANNIGTTTQAMSGAALGVSTGAINGGTVSIKVDDNQSLTTSMTANNTGFADIMRGMAIVANLPQPTTPAEQANYWSMINGAISLLQTGATAVDNDQATLGNTAKQATDLLTQHTDTQTNLQTYISNAEDTDAASVATKFAALQTQMQTSYSLIASMKDMSLVKYL